jgi:hypothetical protein
MQQYIFKLHVVSIALVIISYMSICIGGGGGVGWGDRRDSLEKMDFYPTP